MSILKSTPRFYQSLYYGSSSGNKFKIHLMVLNTVPDFDQISKKNTQNVTRKMKKAKLPVWAMNSLLGNCVYVCIWKWVLNMFVAIFFLLYFIRLAYTDSHVWNERYMYIVYEFERVSLFAAIFIIIFSFSFFSFAFQPIRVVFRRFLFLFYRMLYIFMCLYNDTLFKCVTKTQPK